jgi:uncharacterized repeat protein (TIGR01451 family)
MIMKSHESSFRQFAILVVLVFLLSGAVGPSLFAQISIGPGGFNSTNVCSYSSSIPSGCLVVGNGDATVSGTALQLTTSMGNQFGSAWAVTPQMVGNGFSTTFTFQFTNPSSTPADGIAFVIQNATTGLSAIGYTGGNGGAIGYGDDDGNSSPYSGIPNSLAIEFDSFQNPWDPDADHVAVQSCGIGYNTSHHNQSCSVTGGSSTTSTLGITAAGALAAFPITITDRNPHTVTILYNPPGSYCNASNPDDTNNLCIYIDQQNVTTPVPVLTVPVNLSSLLTLGNEGTTAYVGFTGATGGSWETQDILSWSFSGQPINAGNPASLTQTVVITGTPANPTTEFVADYLDSSNAGTLKLVPNTVPQFTPGAVTPAQYVTLVSNTALAETTCFISPYVLDSMGNPACPSVKIQCTNANSSLLQGDNCPQSSVRNLIFEQILQGVIGGGTVTPPSTEPNIPEGSAPTVAMGPDVWTTSACALAGPEAGQLCPKSIGVAFTDIGGKGGTTGSNSTFILGCCEREYSTAVTINGLPANPSTPVWTNLSTNIPIGFTSTPPPAIMPGSMTLINGNTPAPGQSVTFGTEALGATPDPTLPIAGDTTLPNPNPPSGNTSAPCVSTLSSPLTWGTPPASTFSTAGTILGTFTDSINEVHYFSTDCDEMEELVYMPNGTNNWAKFKTVLFGVDLTDPTISLNTALSPPPTTTNGVPNSYLLNQNVVVPYVCTDPATHGVESGIATCGSHNNVGGPATVNYTDPVPTNTVGSNTITLPVTDVAGNPGKAVSVTYTVVDQPVDLVLFNFPPAPSKIGAGSKLTYVIFGVNLAKTNDAYNVTVTDAIPTGTTLVQAFFAGVPCSSLSSCSSPPTKGTACPLSGTTITCSIGSLAPLDTKSGVAIVIVVNVPAGTKSGTVLLNSATATSWNRITDSYNSIIMSTTVK